MLLALSAAAEIVLIGSSYESDQPNCTAISWRRGSPKIVTIANNAKQTIVRIPREKQKSPPLWSQVKTVEEIGAEGGRQGDVDGDGAADFEVLVQNLSALHRHDIIL